MAEGAIDKPKELTEKEKIAAEFRASIESAIDKNDPKAALKAVVDFATANKSAPDGAVNALEGLEPAKKATLTTLLTTENIEGITQDSRNLLRALAEKITPGSAPEFGKQKPVENILSLIDEQMNKLNLSGNVDALAKKVGFESGDATKFLKNFFVGMAAKVMESIAFSFKQFNPNIEGMLKTPIALRLHQLNITDEKEQKLYTDAYMKRVKQAPNGKGFRPPESLKDAEAILAEPASTQPAVAAEAQKQRTKVQVQEGEKDKKIRTGFKGTPDMLFSKKDNIVTMQSGDKKITLDKKIGSVEVLEATDQDDAVILFTLLDDKSQVKVLASAIKTSEKNVEAENTQSYQKTTIGFTVA